MIPAEQFLYRSFRLLDNGDLRGWLATCADDIDYVVTTAENLRRGFDVALIRDNHDRLEGRIISIEKYWHAETPPTRTHHMVSNVECDSSGEQAVRVHSCFCVTATRRDRQVTLTGRYTDTLRRSGDGWLLAARTAVLDQSVLDGGKLTFIV